MLTIAKNKALFDLGCPSTTQSYRPVLIDCINVFFSLTEKRRREAIAAATCLTEALVDHLNVGYDGDSFFSFCLFLAVHFGLVVVKD